MQDHSIALIDAVCEAIPGWVMECVATIAGAWEAAGGTFPDDVAACARVAGEDAQVEVRAQLQALLAADVDDQRTTPLAIVRSAVRHPTAVLRAAGIPPVERPAFDEERFPDDPYGLTPASLADLDESLGALALAWGAAKAFEHKRRHGSVG